MISTYCPRTDKYIDISTAVSDIRYVYQTTKLFDVRMTSLVKVLNIDVLSMCA